jgi:alginate O-acetyltransferase complex protein AlgI
MFNPMTFARSNPVEYVMPGIKTIVIGIMAFVGSGLLQQLCPVKIKEKWSNSFIEAVFLGVILLLCMASIASGTYNPFIYFRF